MGVEIFAIAFFGAEEQRDAVMPARDDQRDAARGDAHHPIAAQRIADEDGVVLRRRHDIDAARRGRYSGPPALQPVDLVLQACAQIVRHAMQPLRQHEHIDHRRRLRRRQAKFTKQHLAPDKRIAHCSSPVISFVLCLCVSVTLCFYTRPDV